MLAAADTSRRIWSRVLVVGVVLSPIVIKLALFPAYPGSDDAFIHLRIASLVASGSGWGINPGQWTNMSTSPLFTLAVAFITWLGLPSIGASQVLTACAASTGLAFIYLSARRLSPSYPAALFVTALAAINTQLWRWTGAVMEATVAYAAVAMLLYLDLRWSAKTRSRLQWMAIGGLAGLCVLIRFEMALLLVLLLGMRIVRAPNRARSSLGFVAGAAIPLVPYLIFSAWRFGGLIPTTFSAKANHWHVVNTPLLRQITTTYLSAQPATLVVAALGVYLVLRLHRPARGQALERVAVALPLLVGWLAFYYLRAPRLQSAGRYLLPTTVCVAFIAAATIDLVRSRLASVRLGQRVQPGILGGSVVALQLLALAVFTGANIVPVLRDYNDNYRASMTAAAKRIGHKCATGEHVLIEVDIGTIAYSPHGRCVLVDGGALANPELQGLSVAQQIKASRASLVVETLGTSRGSLREQVPPLRLLYSRTFKSHGVEDPNSRFTVNVFSVPP